MFASILAFGGTYRWFLIAFAALALFGVGWGMGASHIARINAQELADAKTEAAKAQSDKDAIDYAAAKADLEARAAKNVTAEAKTQTVYRDRKIFVPNPGKCSAPPAAMKQLNDPSIVGEVQ